MRKILLAPKNIYDQFGQYFPFSTVDVITFQEDSFILTKRNITPYKGMWHLPGGIIRKGEKLEYTSKRAVKSELNIDVKLEKFLGVYENPIRTRHDISHVFIASIAKGEIKNDFQSTSVKFFKKLPNNTIPLHKKMVKDANTLMKNKK